MQKHTSIWSVTRVFELNKIDQNDLMDRTIRPVTTSFSRRHFLPALFLSLTAASGIHAQGSAESRRAISFAKSYLVSRIERGMPTQQFSVWYRSLVGRSTPVSWDVNDCGEQTGTLEDAGRDIPMCVEAEAILSTQLSISISLQVGMFKHRIARRPPVVRFISISDPLGGGTSLNTLLQFQRTMLQRAKDLALFDPNDIVFYVSDADKKLFDHDLDMWVATKAESRTGRTYPVKPYGGISVSQKKLKFRNTVFNGKIWTFETETVENVSYQFEGKFDRYELDAHGAVIGDNVLSGTLSTFVGGHLKDRVSLRFRSALQGE
ncbi:MAG: hypothetical protein ABI878_00345 [Acidobacteriota bacterium]